MNKLLRAPFKKNFRAASPAFGLHLCQICLTYFVKYARHIWLRFGSKSGFSLPSLFLKGVLKMRQFIFTFLFCALCVLPDLNAAEVYLSLAAHGNRSALGISGFVPKSQTIEEAKYAREIQDI